DDAGLASADGRSALDGRKRIAEIANHPLEDLRLLRTGERSKELLSFFESAQGSFLPCQPGQNGGRGTGQVGQVTYRSPRASSRWATSLKKSGSLSRASLMASVCSGRSSSPTRALRSVWLIW